MRKYKGNIPTELEKIYDGIIDRFPSGRLPGHLINTATPDINSIIVEMKRYVTGGDSDQRYTDTQSKADAQQFVDMLESYRGNNSLPTSEGNDNII